MRIDSIKTWHALVSIRFSPGKAKQLRYQMLRILLFANETDEVSHHNAEHIIEQCEVLMAKWSDSILEESLAETK